MKKLLIFDLDGTLADTLPTLTESMNSVLAEFSFPLIDDDHTRVSLGNGMLILCRRCIPAEYYDNENVYLPFLARYKEAYARNYLNLDAPYEGLGEVIAEPVGTLAVDKTAEFMMYKYHRLVFDGIDFGSEGGAEPTVEWLRVEVFIDGVAMEEPFMVLVYENNEANNRFTDYILSEEERPR